MPASYTFYLSSGGAELFTAVLLPQEGDTFPVIVMRDPYVDRWEDEEDSTILEHLLSAHQSWLAHGYAVVFQHCRGRGKSTGDCIPYINEREDGLNLLAWIRQSDFYQGEIYLCGASYCCSVHYVLAPYAEDIKGAIFQVQDTERYNICYRNGFLKIGLHGGWYVGMYKRKTLRQKNYTDASFRMLPLTDFSQRVFGEPSADFDEMLLNPHPSDDFWRTPMGGSDAHNAVKSAPFPILFTTGMFDIYTGGIFDLWRNMDPAARANAALVVSAYGHGDGPEREGCTYPGGRRSEHFGPDLLLQWLQSLRGLAPSPVEKGKITYYSLFENRWKTDDFTESGKTLQIPLGNEAVSYRYAPENPPSFRGGLSCNFGGSLYQDAPGQRQDILHLYTPEAPQDTPVMGKMRCRLTVSSDCEDTCFYVRISIVKPEGDLGLRDDITSLCYQLGDYTPNSQIPLDFTFDDLAFLLKKGERLRVDIASANAAHYVPHTNQKGLYSQITAAKPAVNTVYLQDSCLILPVE